MKALNQTTSHSLKGRRQRDEAPASVEQLFHQHHKNLCRYALRFTQCTHTAEEIVSEVFFKMWQNRDNLQAISSPYGYLVFSTRNACIDYLRRRNRRGSIAGELSQDYQADYASPSELLIGRETQRLIERALESLTPHSRQIFLMSRDSKMTYPEIAAALDLSVKTVETHMRRSLKTLRERLLDAGHPA